jgi:hypothetical protein
MTYSQIHINVYITGSQTIQYCKDYAIITEDEKPLDAQLSNRVSHLLRNRQFYYRSHWMRAYRGVEL